MLGYKRKEGERKEEGEQRRRRLGGYWTYKVFDSYIQRSTSIAI